MCPDHDGRYDNRDRRHRRQRDQAGQRQRYGHAAERTTAQVIAQLVSQRVAHVPWRRVWRAAVLPVAIAVLATGAAGATRAAPEPKSLRGVPLVGQTGLRLLVAADPPFVLDVDSGRVSRVTGFGPRNIAFVSAVALGRDAVLSLGRSVSGRRIEIYVVRHGIMRAQLIGTGTDAAPAADGTGVWVATRAPERCTVHEIGLDGRLRHNHSR